MTDTAQEPIAEFGAAPARAKRSIQQTVQGPELGVTTLDALRDLVAREIEREPIEINVPSRPGLSVRYSVMLDGPRFQAWQRQCSDRKSATGFDDLKLSSIVLANQCVAIVVNEQVVLDDDGEPATFRSGNVADLFGGKDPLATVRKAYANDGHLLAVAAEVVRECGYGEEVAANAADPT